MGVHLVSFRIRDDAGKVGNVKAFAPDSFTVAQLNAFAVTFAEALDAVTAGVIEAASARLNLDLSTATIKATPTADRPIQWGVNIGYNAANTNYRHTQFIPAVDLGLVTDGEFAISDALVTTLTGLMVTGDGTVTPSDEYENDLTGVIGGETTFRKA